MRRVTAPLSRQQLDEIQEFLTRNPSGSVRFTNDTGRQIVVYRSRETGQITVKEL